MRAMRAEMKSILREEITGRGTGCTGAGATRVFTLCVRYHVIIFGRRRGPTAKRRVLRLFKRLADPYTRLVYHCTNVAVLTMSATTLAVFVAGY